MHSIKASACGLQVLSRKRGERKYFCRIARGLLAVIFENRLVSITFKARWAFWMYVNLETDPI